MPLEAFTGGACRFAVVTKSFCEDFKTFLLSRDISKNTARICVKTLSNGRIMTAFADFDETVKPELKEKRIKKGKTVSIVGTFQTVGESALTMNECRITQC